MWKESKIGRYGTLLLLIGAVFFFLKFLVPLVAPVLCAMIFVTIFGPFLQKMNHRFHIHRSVGAVVILILFFASVLLILGLLLSYIISSVPGIFAKLEQLYGDLEQMIREKSDHIGRLLAISGKDLSDSLLRDLSGIRTELAGFFGNGVMMGSLKTIRIIGSVGFFLAVFIIGVVMLSKDYDDMMNKLLDIRELRNVLRVFCEILRYLAALVKAQLVIIPLIGGLCSLTLVLLKVRHGIFWGILTGVLDALPLIGPGLVLFSMALLFVLQGQWGKAVCCLILYGGCVLLRQLLEPRLVGKRMGIAPIVLVLTIYGGIRLFGPAGLIKGPLGYLMVSAYYKSLLEFAADT